MAGNHLLSAGFGAGFNGPLTLVAELPKSGGERSATQTAAHLKTLGHVAAVGTPTLNDAKDVALITVTPTGGPDAKVTEDLVNTIRAQAPTIERETKANVLTTGLTAVNIDVSQRLSSALIPYLLVVVGLAFVLLMIAFRSLLVPLTAIGGFLLTILAALGLLVLVFQDGVGAGLIGVAQSGPIISFLPIMMIGVLFGLAMDYQVFLVSRMREAHAHGASPHDAVRDGFRHGARVVTAAALIMIAVFSGFIIPNDPVTKSVGFAFATGILIDAFVVRMTIIPALMTVRGQKAWWLPRQLERLVPNVDIDGRAVEHHIDAEGSVFERHGLADGSAPVIDIDGRKPALERTDTSR